LFLGEAAGLTETDSAATTTTTNKLTTNSFDIIAIAEHKNIAMDENFALLTSNVLVESGLTNGKKKTKPKVGLLLF
jgi:hypothetical protein